MNTRSWLASPKFIYNAAKLGCWRIAAMSLWRYVATVFCPWAEIVRLNRIAWREWDDCIAWQRRNAELQGQVETLRTRVAVEVDMHRALRTKCADLEAQLRGRLTGIAHHATEGGGAFAASEHGVITVRTTPPRDIPHGLDVTSPSTWSQHGY